MYMYVRQSVSLSVGQYFVSAVQEKDTVQRAQGPVVRSVGVQDGGYLVSGNKVACLLSCS